MSLIRKALQTWLASGNGKIGQLHVKAEGEAFVIRHEKDSHGEEGLKTLQGPAEAREICKYDDAGDYRPLKTAPNLSTGWTLQLQGYRALQEALDAFYPGAVGMWLAHRGNTLKPTSLRETLKRQTGMYRITQLATDEEVSEVIKSACNRESGCLRCLLYDLNDESPLDFLPLEERKPPEDSGDPPEIPLLCREACNLLVAAFRKKVKARPRTES